jgi:hypothetical protein
VLSGHTNHEASCEVLTWQYSFANISKYDEQYMITVTKRILESEKTSKQQNIAIIVVLSDYANNATCCNIVLRIWVIQ